MGGRRIGALVVAVIGLAVAGCGDDGAPPATTSSPSVDAGDAPTPVVRLEPGECFDGPDLEEGSTDTARSVTTVPCAEPHLHEVYHAFEFSEDEPFPGDATIVELAEEGCAEAFATRLGDTAALEQLSLWPTEESWSEGDRRVLCAAFPSDGEPLVGRISPSS